MNKSILITGGAGYIGSHTAFYFYQKGYEVIILDSFISSPPFNPDWAIVYKADYADIAILDKIFVKHSIGTVMHFASSTQVVESMTNPGLYYENNVAKTICFLNCMLKNGVNNLIFSSSCAVYGIPEFLPLMENHTKNPISIYGKTKLIIENILEDYSKCYNFNYIALRYFNAAGALPEYSLGENHMPETHLIPLVFCAAKENKPFNIFGTNYNTKDGTCVRDYLHVVDIADAHWRAYIHLQHTQTSDVFNLGTGAGFTVKEIIKSVEKTYGCKIKTVEKPNRPGDSAVLIADYSKAKNILGWSPKNSELNFIINSVFVYQNKCITKFSRNQGVL